MRMIENALVNSNAAAPMRCRHQADGHLDEQAAPGIRYDGIEDRRGQDRRQEPKPGAQKAHSDDGQDVAPASLHPEGQEFTGCCQPAGERSVKGERLAFEEARDGGLSPVRPLGCRDAAESIGMVIPAEGLQGGGHA